jgi:hypothetical protein
MNTKVIEAAKYSGSSAVLGYSLSTLILYFIGADLPQEVAGAVTILTVFVVNIVLAKFNLLSDGE